MKHTPQSKVDKKKKRLCVSPVIKSVTIISDTQILSYRFNLCVVTYQYKVSLFCLSLHVTYAFWRKKQFINLSSNCFFSLDVYLLTLLYIFKKVCWEIEKEYPMCVVNLLCLYINLHIIEKAPQREGRKNVTASRW